jgi:tRNA(fMet)-specific endonuclease VapC
VTAERSATSLDGVIEDEDDVAIAAITAAELLVGVELSEGKSRQRRRAFVEDVLRTIPIETYDLDVAGAHASLLAHTRRSGRPREAHDLLIAATALTHGRTSFRPIRRDSSTYRVSPFVASVKSPGLSTTRSVAATSLI